MNPYLVFVLVVLVGGWLIESLLDWLNLRYPRAAPPPEFAGVCEQAEYRRSRDYLRDTTRFGLLRGTVGMVFLVVFIVVGGFGWVELAARWVADGEIPRGVVFVGILGLGATVLAQPFELYDTFVIEARYGFNRTTKKTYVLDLVKTLALAAVIGLPVFALITALFLWAGDWAWLLAWAAVTVLQVGLLYLAPVLIMPLFNSFTRLPEGSLRERIESYAAAQDFPLADIQTMDGSRRSSKANAYFTGFGKSRRIVFFDTLLEQHDEAELLAILAHELGHWRRRHVAVLTGVGILTTGLLFFLLSLFIGNAGLFAAFGMPGQPTVYASLVFVGFLFAPLNLLLGVGLNVLSRRFEYQADADAAASTGQPEALVRALKKLSVENLSDLTPHPAKVFVEYSHPPVVQRIRALRRQGGQE